MKFTLNKQQLFILNRVVDWFYHSSKQTIQIVGGAGTGKSYLLAAILDKLNLSESEILPIAYTGQACSVMRKRGLSNAKTCHSALFTPMKRPLKDKNGNIIMNKTFNTPFITWEFKFKDFYKSGIKLIIVDEAWMVPKKFKQYIDNTGIKVIATGDPNQLPPIADEPGYLIDGEIYRLTELMRQSENSPIVYLANRALKGLPIECGLYGNDALVIYDDEFTNDIISRSSVVLCGKNKTREKINNIVRNDILNIHTDYPNIGERLICRKNNWDLSVDDLPLVNGTTGSVVLPPDIGKFDGETLSIDFLPDMASHPFRDLRINYNFLNSNYAEKSMLSNDKFFVGEKFEYSYASTVHLSQGSEYDCGTYVEEYLRSDIQNSLNYTAITRFKQKMVYVKYRPKYWNSNY